MPDSRREYGLGESTSFVTGKPQVVRVATGLPPCPHCGCDTLYEIEVECRHPLLAGGEGLGHYVGCPACPFASPMMIASGGVK